MVSRPSASSSPPSVGVRSSVTPCTERWNQVWVWSAARTASRVAAGPERWVGMVSGRVEREEDGWTGRAPVQARYFVLAGDFTDKAGGLQDWLNDHVPQPFELGGE